MAVVSRAGSTVSDDSLWQILLQKSKIEQP
jgi:hypothetical protein